VRRFPYVMHLTRTNDDPTTSTGGVFSDRAGLIVKYQSEYFEAERFSRRIVSREDWRDVLSGDLHASGGRVYTAHGTVVYVDEDSGALRHGPLDHSPENALLVVQDTTACFRHLAGTETFGLEADGGGFLGSLRSKPSTAPRRPATFNPVHFQGIHWPDTWGWANNLIGLRLQDRFLSAEPGGALVANRSECHAWEQFRVIRPRDLRARSQRQALRPPPRA
jgi:hypothetical protein